MFHDNELKTIMTAEEYREEILGRIIFLVSLPVIFISMWMITPA